MRIQIFKAPHSTTGFDPTDIIRTRIPLSMVSVLIIMLTTHVHVGLTLLSRRKDISGGGNSSKMRKRYIHAIQV